MPIVKDVMIKDFLKIDAKESLAKAIGKMRAQDQRVAVIFDKKKYKGIIARRQLYMAKVDPVKAKVGVFAKSPPIVTSKTDLVEAAELMYHAYPCVLIVKRGDKLLGIVRARDFIHQIKDIPSLAKLKVADIMTPNPICFEYNARIGDAMSLMREKGIGRVPVVDSSGKLLSVLSFTDIEEKYLLRPKSKIKGVGKAATRLAATKGAKAWAPNKIFLLDTNIGDEASRIVITVSPKTKLRKAINEMYEYKISDVIVTENKKPVGIVTTRDLLETYFRLKAPEYWGIQYYGLEHLKPLQANGLKELVEEAFEKFRRAYFKDIIYLVVHIKPYEEGLVGKAARHGRTKWSLRLRLATPALIFTTESAHFHLSTAISWAIKMMEKELQRFKVKRRERRQEIGKKGRRAIFEHFERRQKAKKGLGPVYPPLVKRK